MLATLRHAQRSAEVVRPRQALLAAPSVRASHTSQAMKRSLIGSAKNISGMSSWDEVTYKSGEGAGGLHDLPTLCHVTDMLLLMITFEDNVFP